MGQAEELVISQKGDQAKEPR